jgi:hypothetical protein
MMTRHTIVVLGLLALRAMPASAQATTATTAATVDRLQLPAVDVAAFLAADQAPRQAPRPIPPLPPPSDTPRRRGSMVGYIDDPVVSTKLRIRYEGGWHNPSPDRAEFFYGKCGCYNNPALGAYFDPDAPGPGPGAASDVNFKQLQVMGEFATSDSFSVFAELPVRWLQPQAFIPGTGAPFDNQSGIGDIKVGARFGLSAKPGQALTAQARVFLPSGDAAKGLGTDHVSFEPAILAYRELSPRVAVEGQFAAWIPMGGSAGLPTSADAKFAGPVITYGIGPSFVVYEQGRTRVAPVVELVGWHVTDGFQTPPIGPADANTVNLKVGGRVSWTSQTDSLGSLYVGYGKALTDAKWYDDILRVEYRWSF